MTTWTYTKKLISEHANAASREAWRNPDWVTAYTDWYHNQVEAGLADPDTIDTTILPESWSADDLTCETLCSDQAQIESLIALAEIWMKKLTVITLTITDYKE